MFCMCSERLVIDVKQMIYLLILQEYILFSISLNVGNYQLFEIKKTVYSTSHFIHKMKTNFFINSIFKE
jgi:hypothetical protein